MFPGSTVIYLKNKGETDPKKLGMAGAAAVLPVILRWLNPNDTAFGSKGK